MNNRYYKRLTEDMVSPYQNFRWKLNKPVVIDDFDDTDIACSRGLYYLTDKQLLWTSTLPLFEVAVGGQVKIFHDKNRCSEMTILRRVPTNEIIEIARQVEPEMGFCYEEALFPVNPFGVTPPKRIESYHLDLLREWASLWVSLWASVRDSIGDSVWQSVRDNVVDSVWRSVRDCVWDSVACNCVWDSFVGSLWDSVKAYTGSLFPNVTTWKYVDHKPGEYPFAPASDLWRMGLVPTFDGTLWRLHAGPDANVVWRGDINE